MHMEDGIFTGRPDPVAFGTSMFSRAARGTPSGAAPARPTDLDVRFATAR
jgi:hypothetical protein